LIAVGWTRMCLSTVLKTTYPAEAPLMVVIEAGLMLLAGPYDNAEVDDYEKPRIPNIIGTPKTTIPLFISYDTLRSLEHQVYFERQNDRITSVRY
jgi:hypothetical protein